jgi:hypothetical protein
MGLLSIMMFGFIPIKTELIQTIEVQNIRHLSHCLTARGRDHHLNPSNHAAVTLDSPRPDFIVVAGTTDLG